MRRGTWLAGALLASTLLTAPLGAQEGAGAAGAAAEALFNQGLIDLKAKKYGTACPLFAESYRHEPLNGTLFTLAECEAGAGLLASAVLHYSDFLDRVSHLPPADQQQQRARQERAHAQQAELRPQVPLLTLRMPAGAPEGTTVRRGAMTLGAASFGIALPVDPGVHVLRSQRPGGPWHEQRVEIRAGEKKTVVVELEAERGLAPAAPESSAPAPTSTVPPPEPKSAPPPGGLRRPLMVGSLVVGGVGIAAGSVTGLLAIQKKHTVDGECATPRTCTQAGKDAADGMKSLGAVSTAAMAVGGVGLAVGLVLLFTAQREPERSAVALRPSVAGGPRELIFGLGGVFR